MKQANISKILPTIQEHFNPFFEEKENQKNVEQIIYQSKEFQNLFYAKKSLKKLLQERTETCISLNLSSRNTPKTKILTPQFKQQLMKCLISLFSQCPSELDAYSFALVEDKKTIYIFFASQQKYIPLCKWCNKTVYISLRESHGRIACMNLSCKVKLLYQFSLEENSHEEKAERQSNFSSKGRHLKSQVIEQESERSWSNLNEQQRQQIKKTVKKIIN